MTPKTVLELIRDEREHAYDDLVRDYPTVDPTEVAALVENVVEILAEAARIEDAATTDRFMTSWELAQEHRWLAEDAITAFLSEVVA